MITILCRSNAAAGHEFCGKSDTLFVGSAFAHGVHPAQDVTHDGFVVPADVGDAVMAPCEGWIVIG
jgi:hypothetical protein